MLKVLGKVVVIVGLVGLSSIAIAGPININTADAMSIAENIKGIGPKKAEAIVAYRKQHGPFKNAQDLGNVKGIGQKTIEKNKENIIISDSGQIKTEKDVRQKLR